MQRTPKMAENRVLSTPTSSQRVFYIKESIKEEETKEE